MSTDPPPHISYGKPPPQDGRLPGFSPRAAGERQPLDWITEFAIPLGIIGLLGSFLYYLIDLRTLMGGGAGQTLMWVCFFFLLGTVFVTRVRTKFGESAIAAPYIIGLAAAIGLFIWQFTMWSGSLAGRQMAGGRLIDLMFNYAIVGLIWYGASRLTRECTAEETTQRAGEEGMLNDIASRDQRQRSRPIGDRRAAKHPGWLHGDLCHSRHCRRPAAQGLGPEAATWRCHSRGAEARAARGDGYARGGPAADSPAGSYRRGPRRDRARRR